MVLNDIIEQAAGRQSRASEHGGRLKFFLLKFRKHPTHYYHTIAICLNWYYCLTTHSYFFLFLN